MDNDESLWQLELTQRPCPEVLRFVIPGDPVSKERPRFSGKNTFTPDKTRLAEQAVAWHARAAGLRGVPDATASYGLLCVFFTANWRRRDTDNMLKLVADALNKIAYHDDSQLTEVSGRVVRADGTPRTHVLLYRTTLQQKVTSQRPGHR